MCPLTLSPSFIYPQKHIIIYMMAGILFVLNLSVSIYGMENSIQFPQGMKGHPVNMAGVTCSIDYSFLTWYDKYGLIYQLHRFGRLGASVNPQSAKPGVSVPRSQKRRKSHSRRYIVKSRGRERQAGSRQRCRRVSPVGG